MSASTDDYENALWSKGFYSSSDHISLSSLASHLSTLRKQINIPNSESTTLIKAGLLDAPNIPDRESRAQKTSFIKASPSIKALESIMNERSEKTVPQVDKIEEEEEEPELHHPENASSSANSFSPAKYENLGSASTFHTANSGHSNHSTHSTNTTYNTQNHDSPGRYSSSISTIGELGYNDGTPQLDPPAAVFTVKRTTRDYSPQLLHVTGSFPEKDADSARTKVLSSVSDDQDSTVVEEDEKGKIRIPEHKNTEHRPSLPQNQSKLSVSTIENPANRSQSTNASSQKPSSSFASPKQQQSFPPPVKSLLDVEPTPKQQMPKSASSALGLQEPFRATPQKTQPSTPKETFHSKPPKITAPNPEASPHQRTQSSSSSTAQSSPSMHKRSNTMGDISKLKNSKPQPAPPQSAPKPAASKRFSFRGLFKMKSKNHSLNKVSEIPEEPSRPTKLHSKSFSSPNFGALYQNNESNTPKEDSKGSKLADKYSKPMNQKGLFNGFRRKKSEADLAAINKPKETPEPKSEPKNDRRKSFGALSQPPKPFASASSSNPPSGPLTPSTKNSVDDVETPATNTLAPPEADYNTIREVDDSDYNLENLNSEIKSDNDGSSRMAESTVTPQVEVSPIAELDRATRHTNNFHGEEMSLGPRSPKLELPSFMPGGDLFGSPFAANYSPSSSKPPASKRSSTIPQKSDQLLGEALFPKLLNPQEIESIVSLERSRSMKSIKSNSKRSSYINYDGNDDNIVIYSGEAGKSSPTGIKRSGSILKNSLSGQSLNGIVNLIDQTVSDAKSPTPSQKPADPAVASSPYYLPLPELDGEDSFNDLLEFSEFIDPDQFDFSASVPNSPSPPLVADEVQGDDSPLESHSIPLPNIQVSSPPPAPSEFNSSSTPINAQAEGSSERNETQIQDTIEETPSREEAETQKEQDQSHSVIVISDESADQAVTPHGANKNITINTDLESSEEPEAISKLPILGVAMEEVKVRESPNISSRPISMSFKGFKGPAISKSAVAKTGSHQLLAMDDSSNESSAVGQGFGSSDEDSDEEFSSDEENTQAQYSRGTPKQPLQAPGLKAMSNTANIRQASPKTMGLQPPAGPFYHDRIPSLSDNSAQSSPRLFTSFISKMRRSPMVSPKVEEGGVRFLSRIILYDTYNCEEYDRHPDIATCNQLTPLLAQQIKDELNEIKSEMLIHEDSQCYTHFF